jgi:hypothetical protein
LYRINLRTLWDLWWSGNPSQNSGGFRFIHGQDLYINTDKPYLSKGKVVMKSLLSADASLIHSNIPRMSFRDRDELFSRLFQDLLLTIDPDQSIVELDKRNVGNLSYLTVYDYVNRHNKRSRIR